MFILHACLDNKTFVTHKNIYAYTVISYNKDIISVSQQIKYINAQKTFGIYRQFN